jgi:alpha-aminoadipate carrier protein LysW
MSTPTTTPATATCECPECAAAITLSRTPMRGEVLRCADCAVELEVTATAPLTLALAPEVQEDWGE